MVSQEIRRALLPTGLSVTHSSRERADGTLQGHRGRKHQGVRRQKEQGKERRESLSTGRARPGEDKQAEDWLSEWFCRLWGYLALG